MVASAIKVDRLHDEMWISASMTSGLLDYASMCAVDVYANLSSEIERKLEC